MVAGGGIMHCDGGNLKGPGNFAEAFFASSLLMILYVA
jgi:hypothetical protein